jgi:hypothetical protein
VKKDYMPLRFKAVDPATGAQSEVFEIRPKQAGPLGYAWTVGADNYGFKAKPEADPILCQSTGLTDAAKTEIFSHAVMVHPEHGDYEYTPFYLVCYHQEHGVWVYYEICNWDSLRTGCYDLVTENPYPLWENADEMYVVGAAGMTQEQAWEAAKTACNKHWDLGDPEQMMETNHDHP